MAGNQNRHGDATAQNQNDSAETTRAGSGQPFAAPDYQAGSGHPTFRNQRVDRFDLPQLTITNERQQQQFIERADTNRDGILEEAEIEKRLQNRRLNGEERKFLLETKENFQSLSGLSTAEYGHERGITGSDMVAHRERLANPEYRDSLMLPAERAKMLDSAQRKLSPEQLRQFKEDMTRFEFRMEGNQTEIAKTYKEVSRLLNPQGGTVVDTRKLGALAMDVMHQASDPRKVNQGDRNTCTLASLESRIYTRHPSEAARLVADVATTGNYTTADGNRISVDRASVNMFPKHWRDSVSDESNARSHASQIFQLTAANTFEDSDAGIGGRRTEYKMKVAENGEVKEELVDRNTGEVIGNHPGITIFQAEGLHELNRRITGANEPPFVIDLSKARTPEEFRRNLEEIGRNQNYPALLAVNALNPPFRPEGIDLRRGALPAVPYHMVAIEPGRSRESVFVNDQYGPDRDREHPIDTIYQATKLPKEVIGMRGWSEQVVKGLEMLENSSPAGQPVDPAIARIVRSSIHEYTPEHMDAIDKAYQASTGRPLADVLKRFLPDEDMKALGYRSNWFSDGWHRRS